MAELVAWVIAEELIRIMGLTFGITTTLFILNFVMSVFIKPIHHDYGNALEVCFSLEKKGLYDSFVEFMLSHVNLFIGLFFFNFLFNVCVTAFFSLFSIPIFWMIIVPMVMFGSIIYIYKNYRDLFYPLCYFFWAFDYCVENGANIMVQWYENGFNYLYDKFDDVRDYVHNLTAKSKAPKEVQQ